jgi:hypothetical protein
MNDSTVQLSLNDHGIDDSADIVDGGVIGPATRSTPIRGIWSCWARAAIESCAGYVHA